MLYIFFPFLIVNIRYNLHTLQSKGVKKKKDRRRKEKETEGKQNFDET